MAEPTIQEVKSAVEEAARLWQTEFAETKKAIAELKAKGNATDPLLTEKLDRLNAAYEKQAEVNEKYMETRAIVDRLAALGMNADGKPQDREIEVRAFNLSLRAHAAERGRVVSEVTQETYAAYKSAFDLYLRAGERGLSDTERKAMSVGSDVNGGYLVTPDMSGRMVKKLFETSPMRQYASAQTISTDALEGSVDTDEATVGWVGELGSRSTNATPTVPVPWRIPAHEIFSNSPVSQKLLEDANIDVSAWLADKVSDKISRTVNAAFVTGTGVSKPRGFASYTTAATADSSRSWGVFEHVATGANGAFGTDPAAITKLVPLIHAMKDGHAANAAFYMNRTTLGGLRVETDASSSGKFVFIPSFQAGFPDQVMGYPVRRLQDMATYTTTDALAIAFGDMQATYQIVDRLGITVLVDPYTNKPYVNFYTRLRVGGDCLNFDAMKFLKFGS